MPRPRIIFLILGLIYGLAIGVLIGFFIGVVAGIAAWSTFDTNGDIWSSSIAGRTITILTWASAVVVGLAGASFGYASGKRNEVTTETGAIRYSGKAKVVLVILLVILVVYGLQLALTYARSAQSQRQVNSQPQVSEEERSRLKQEDEAIYSAFLAERQTIQNMTYTLLPDDRGVDLTLTMAGEHHGAYTLTLDIRDFRQDQRTVWIRESPMDIQENVSTPTVTILFADVAEALRPSLTATYTTASIGWPFKITANLEPMNPPEYRYLNPHSSAYYSWSDVMLPIVLSVTADNHAVERTGEDGS